MTTPEAARTIEDVLPPLELPPFELPTLPCGCTGEEGREHATPNSSSIPVAILPAPRIAITIPESIGTFTLNSDATD